MFDRPVATATAHACTWDGVTKLSSKQLPAHAWRTLLQTVGHLTHTADKVGVQLEPRRVAFRLADARRTKSVELKWSASDCVSKMPSQAPAWEMARQQAPLAFLAEARVSIGDPLTSIAVEALNADRVRLGCAPHATFALKANAFARVDFACQTDGGSRSARAHSRSPQSVRLATAQLTCHAWRGLVRRSSVPPLHCTQV